MSDLGRLETGDWGSWRVDPDFKGRESLIVPCTTWLDLPDLARSVVVCGAPWLTLMLYEGAVVFIAIAGLVI